MAFPINIRYRQPQTVDDIVIGNYFTCAFMSVPLDLVDFRTLLGRLHRNLKKIKTSSETYGMYLVSLILGAIFPYEATYWMIHEVSRRISFQFSNLPGPRDPIVIQGHKSEKAWIFVNPGAQQGCSLTLYSHAGIVKFAATTDIARIPDPKLLVRLFEETLDEMLDKDGGQRKLSLINPED